MTEPEAVSGRVLAVIRSIHDCRKYNAYCDTCEVLAALDAATQENERLRAEVQEERMLALSGEETVREYIEIVAGLRAEVERHKLKAEQYAKQLDDRWAGVVDASNKMLAENADLRRDHEAQGRRVAALVEAGEDVVAAVLNHVNGGKIESVVNSASRLSALLAEPPAVKTDHGDQ